MATSRGTDVQAFSPMAWLSVRRRGGWRYATLPPMHRADVAPFSARFPAAASSAWLARRWYYTAKTHRAYSVRQISPGDRRLLAEFSLQLTGGTPECEHDSKSTLTSILFDRVLNADSNDPALGFAALEGTSAGDRVIGVAAYAPLNPDCAEFTVAVAAAYREEQIGRTLLCTLLRHAKRAGLPALTGQMVWSNRAMHVLATSLGFAVAAEPGDRKLRRLALQIK